METDTACEPFLLLEKAGHSPNKHSGALWPRRGRELALERPEIVKAVYQGFCGAKAAMAGQLVKGMTFNSMATMVPWLTKLIGENRDLLGDDWWPYGIEANRKALDTYLRYHFEQGLSKRRMTCEDIFVPELLGT